MSGPDTWVTGWKQDFVLRQEHEAGEKLFVDWARTTIPIHDPRGGPAQQAHLFVAVLGASSIAPGTDCSAHNNKSPRPVPGAHAHNDGIQLTG
jgi:transposase